MNFSTYQAYINSILARQSPAKPYDDPKYRLYVKLNWARLQRWLQVGVINTQLHDLVQSLEINQSWKFITEPWCGDAPHILPFVYKISQANAGIDLDIVLRDSPPYLINSYLTGQSKSIPKLIVRDENGKDMFVWGPRPEKCQELFLMLKNSKMDDARSHEQMQQWYNNDRGVSFQDELFTALTNSRRLTQTSNT